MRRRVGRGSTMILALGSGVGARHSHNVCRKVHRVHGQTHGTHTHPARATEMPVFVQAWCNNNRARDTTTGGYVPYDETQT